MAQRDTRRPSQRSGGAEHAMATFQQRVQSIIQGVSRLQDVRGEVELEPWISESITDVDEQVWSIVEALAQQERIPL